MNPYISFEELQPKRVLRTQSTKIKRKMPYGEVITIKSREKDGEIYESVYIENTIWKKEIVKPKKGKITLIFDQKGEDLLGYEVEDPEGNYTFYALSGRKITDYDDFYSYTQGVMLFKMHDGRLVVWQGCPKDQYSQSIVVNPGEEYHMYLVKHDDPKNKKMYYNVPYFYLKDSDGNEIIWRIRNQMFPIISTTNIPKQNFFKTVECDEVPIKSNLKYYFDKLHEVNYG